MKKITFFILLVVTALLTSCRKDTENITTEIFPPDPPELEILAKVSLTGVVLNENGAPVVDARVSAGGQQILTDEKGVFIFNDITVNTRAAIVTVQHPDYFHNSRVMYIQPFSKNTVQFRMLSNTAEKFVSNQTGGTVDFGNYSIALPAQGVVTASGQEYSGMVGVAAKWLNPTDTTFCMQAPGRLEGIDAQGQRTGMVSMGMLAVELSGAGGEPLQIKAGYEAGIRIKVPQEIIGRAPATIPLWHFDENTQLWKEEGSATLQNGCYEGKVRHFSFWNCDYPRPTVSVTIRVLTTSGQPVRNTLVTLTFTDGGGQSTGYTDNNGYVSGRIPQSVSLDASVSLNMPGCTGSIYTQSLGAFETNVNITLTVELPAIQTYNLTGQLTDCNGNPVTNGYVTVEGWDTPFTADATGYFDVPLISCPGLNEVSVTGTDFATAAISQVQIVPVIGDSAQAGTMVVCEQLGSYFTYSGGGILFLSDTITISPIDSVPGGPVEGVYGFVWQNNTAAQFSIKDFTGLGSFTCHYFVIEGSSNGTSFTHDCSGASNCANMIFQITEFGGAGGYIGGTYSGTLYNNNQQPPVPITVSGSFRGKY